MIVGMVAAPDNPLPLANAIPMVMGANIGTTVTNTVVALAHLGRKDEFRRAFAVATCHDFFNFMSVAILLPLELATGYLRATAAHLAGFFSAMTGVEYDSPISASLKASVAPLIDFSKLVSESAQTQGILISILSGVLIFGALLALVKTLRSAILAKAETYVEDTLGRSALLAILIGVVVTVMVQSSSITTSLLVPLAGAGVLTLQSAFPVTLGANIGTTVTALLASMAVSGENAQAGVTIALVHTLFNLSGTLLIYPVPAIRRIPLAAAEKLAEIATRSRKWAILYVMILFYGVPALFALLDRWL
jgi:sodium-dependent phosphate cotransporter